MLAPENLCRFLAISAIAHGEAVQEGDDSGTIHLREFGQKATKCISDFTQEDHPAVGCTVGRLDAKEFGENL